MTATESLRFICSGCGYRARIPASYQNKVILCPGCQQTQIATADSSAATGDTVRYSRVSTAGGTDRFSKPEEDGRLVFTCSACAFSAKLAATYAGKAISCPKCQAPQLIPPLEPAGGPPTGKPQPPQAESRAAEVKNADDVSEQRTAATTEAPSTLSSHQQSPPSPADELELSFDDAPVTAPPASSAPRRSLPPAPPAPPSPRATDKPVTGGVKRRGNRMAMPTVAAVEEDDVDDEEPIKEKKPLPPWAEQAKQPKVLMVAGSALALLIVLIGLISGWSSAANSADEQRQLAQTNKELADKENKARKDIEWKLSQTEEALAQAKKAEAEAKAALAATEMRARELTDNLKKAEDERQDEYAKRKKAEADHDELFAKLKSLEAAREEDYRIRNDLRKKYDEEARLRKELNGQLKAALEEIKNK